jgi:hypothetical protein
MSTGEGVALAPVAALVGAAALWLGSAPWPVPIAVVVVVNLVLLAITVFADTPNADIVAAMIRVGRVFLPASLIATVACWLLTRQLLRFA